MKLDLKKKIDLSKAEAWKVVLLTICLILAFSIVAGAFNDVSENAASLATATLLYVGGGVCLLVLDYLVFNWGSEGDQANHMDAKKLAGHLCSGFLVGFLLLTVVAALLYLLGDYKVVSVTFQPSLVRALAFFFFVACAEEVTFRGVLFRIVDQRWNYLTAMIVTGIAYAVLGITYSDANLWAGVAIAVVGLLMGAAYKSSGTLWLPIGMHWAMDFTLVSLLGFPMSGDHELPSLIHSSTNGSAPLTGGDSAPAASVLFALLGILLTAYFSKRVGQKRP